MTKQNPKKVTRNSTGTAPPDAAKEIVAAWSPYWFILSLAILTALLYAPTLQAPFMLDDFSSIVENPVIRTLDLPAIYRDEPMRFVSYLSYALNFHFSKLNPLPYHVTNLLIHLCYVMSAFIFFQTLWQTPSGKALLLTEKRKQILAMAAATIIAIHPLNTFAISYIVQRATALAALFYLLTLLFYLNARLSSRQWKPIHLLLMVISMGLSLKSKQNAFTLFPMILAMEIFCFKISRRKTILMLTGFAATMVALFILIQTGKIDLQKLDALTRETRDIPRHHYLMTQFSVICFYLAQLIFPSRLALDYQQPIHTTFTEPAVFIPCLFLTALSFYAFRCLFNPSKRLIGFGILFYFIALSVESSLIPIRDPIFLHRTYLPNTGAILCLILTFHALIPLIPPKRRQRVVISMISGIIALYGYHTFQTNQMLSSPLKVWQQVTRISPDFSRGHTNLGWQYLETGDMKRAEKHMMRAYELDPKNIKNINNISVLYRKLGQEKRAIALLEKLIRQHPDFTEGYTSLGNAYSEKGEYRLAMETFRKGLKVDPHDYTLMLSLGQHLAATAKGGDREKQLREALEWLQRAMEIDDLDPVLHYAVAMTRMILGDLDGAEAGLKKALLLKPDFESASKALERIQKEHPEKK